MKVFDDESKAFFDIFKTKTGMKVGRKRLKVQKIN